MNERDIGAWLSDIILRVHMMTLRLHWQYIKTERRIAAVKECHYIAKASPTKP